MNGPNSSSPHEYTPRPERTDLQAPKRLLQVVPRVGVGDGGDESF